MQYFFIVFAVIILLFAFLYYENNKIDLTKYYLKSNNIDSRIKIAHLSDLHSKPFKQVLDKLEKEKPDIIFITGDYINDRMKNLDKMLIFARELVKIAPVYYITGNHERRLENFEEVMQELSDCGFNVLLDEIKSFEIKGNRICVLGLDENQADFKDYKARRMGTFQYKNMKPLFDELDKESGYKIVLSHFPENFEGISELNYSQYDFDIQLSGHAHGGQVILPFIGPVYSPGQGLFPKYARGSLGERPKLIISRGLGNAEFPFRLFNHPEINIIRISKKIKNSEN
ncbi:MAG: metallophosphoesterase [Eubacterium sp.]|nr:metallophosphoesterase [Eubacterium sp.]